MLNFGRLMDATAAGYRAFVGTMTRTEASQGRSGGDATWDTHDARCLRASVWRAFYDGTAYEKGHPWSPSYKVYNGTPKHIRGVYNPCHRLGRFYIARLLGGKLDPKAGDGVKVASAIPIETDNEPVRVPIAKLWKDSSWSVNKDICSNFVAVESAAGIKVVDDPIRKHVRLELVPTSELAWVEFDDLGNVKGYEIRRDLPDPRLPPVPIKGDRTKPRQTVKYREICLKERELIRFVTLLNDEYYPWNGKESTWTADIGFAPLTVAQFEPVGMTWAANCFYAGMGRFREADGLASSLTDQAHKAIRNPLLITNCQSSDLAFVDDPDKLNIACIDRPDVKVTSMTFDLDVTATKGHIADIVANFERDYPELRTDPGAMMGTPTAEAIRAAKAESTTMVEARRINVDDALARAQMMAISIGGLQRYEGYRGFGLDSFDRNLSLHRIGPRPVFAEDPAEKLDLETKRSGIVTALVAAGTPLPEAYEQAGYPKDVVSRIRTAKAEADAESEARANRQAQAEQAGQFANDEGDNS